MNSKKLKEFLDSRNIEGVVFDVDNTLLATGQYYTKSTRELGIQIAPMIDNSREPEEISKEIEEVLYSEYIRNGRKPELIDNRYISAIRKYWGRNVPKEIELNVIDFYKDFYLKSPTPFEYSADVLKAFLDLDKSVVLHSHAQEEWTKIKVDLLEELVGEDLPYLSTAIYDEKDKESWLKAFELTKSKPENTLVVGDNFEADILPAIDAGCKYLVWLDTHSVGLEEEYTTPEGVEIVVINKIEDILNLE
jgi:FMN phosphatase YigB (HAD superfamily)